MATTSLRFEDRLDGGSNFLSWKARVTLLLKEHNLWEIAEKVDPTPIDVAEKATLEKDIKADRVILDDVTDHLIPHMAEKHLAKEMFEALVDLFHSDNLNRNMILRNKLIYIQMSRFGNVTSYFVRITQTHDKLVAIEEKVDDVGLVNVALNGFTKSREPSVKGVCAWGKNSNWESLWEDCIQEETWEEYKSSRKIDGEENMALVTQAKKGKGKGSKGNNEGETSQPRMKKDLIKIKCFVCHKSGHYTSQCLKKKKGQGKSQHVATSTETQLDEFVVKFEKEFTLVSCLSTNTVVRSE
jgi:hypothetical protein